MTTVPYKERVSLRPVNRTEIAQVHNGQAGAAIGQSLQSLGNAGVNMADAMDARDQIKAKADTDAAITDYMDRRRNVLHDPDAGYLNQQGGNALDQRETLDKRLKEERAAATKGLSPRALRAFDEQADRLDAQGKDAAIKHESSELRAYSRSASEAAIAAAMEEAGLFYDDQKAADGYLGEAIAKTREQAALEGWPKEQTDLRVAEIVSNVTVNHAMRVAQSNPAAVEDFLTANADRIMPDAAHDLRVKLKPIIVDAKAREFVDPMLASMDGSDDQYGVPKWLGKAESNNNRFAENELSSATGTVQFLDETYIGVVESLLSRGAAQWANGLSRAELLATRSDRAKEGEVYREFRRKNANALTIGGFEVSPRNEYIMHHMGAGTGLAMLRQAEANPAMGFYGFLAATEGASRATEIVNANPWMQGRSVRSALNFFENKAGGNRAVANPGQAYRAALEIEDPDVRDAAIAMIEQRIAVSERAEAHDRDEAMESAYEDIVTNGLLPKNLPVEQQLLIGQTGMQTLMNAASNYATGADVHDETAYLELFDLAHSTDAAAREEFLNRNLNEEADHLSQSSLLGLKQMQVEMRDALETVKTGMPGDTIYSTDDFPKIYNTAKDVYQANTGYRPGQASNTPEEAQRWVQFTGQLKQAMVAYANENNAAMPPSLIDQTIGLLLTPAIINPRGPLNEREVNLFDAPFREAGATVELAVEATQIPLDKRENLTRRLTTAYGRAPSEDEVVEQYERELLAKHGLLPEMDFSDIPKDLRRQLQKEYPDASEEQVIDLFLSTVNSRIQSLGE